MGLTARLRRGVLPSLWRSLDACLGKSGFDPVAAVNPRFQIIARLRPSAFGVGPHEDFIQRIDKHTFAVG